MLLTHTIKDHEMELRSHLQKQIYMRSFRPNCKQWQGLDWQDALKEAALPTPDCSHSSALQLLEEFVVKISDTLGQPYSSMAAFLTQTPSFKGLLIRSLGWGTILHFDSVPLHSYSPSFLLLNLLLHNVAGVFCKRHLDSEMSSPICADPQVDFLVTNLLPFCEKKWNSAEPASLWHRAYTCHRKWIKVWFLLSV